MRILTWIMPLLFIAGLSWAGRMIWWEMQESVYYPIDLSRFECPVYSGNILTLMDSIGNNRLKFIDRDTGYIYQYKYLKDCPYKVIEYYPMHKKLLADELMEKLTPFQKQHAIRVK